MYRIATILRACSLVGMGCLFGVLFVGNSRYRDIPVQMRFNEQVKLNKQSTLPQTSKNQDEAKETSIGRLEQRLRREIMNEMREKLRGEILKERETNNSRILVQEQSMASVRQSLSKIKAGLAAAHRLSKSADVKRRIRESFGIIDGLLSTPSATAELDNPPILPKTDSPSMSPVCPEKYKGSTFGYPYFYNGFDMEKCANKRGFFEIITILLDFHEEDGSPKSLMKVKRILNNIKKYYANVSVIVTENGNLNLERSSTMDVVKMPASASGGLAWKTLVERAQTDYVFIGRDLDYFDWNARLERLVREIYYLNVPVAGSSTRIENGHWSMACQQLVYRNYTLTFRNGYDISQHECVYCDYVSGPFVAVKSYLLHNPLNEILGRHAVFEDLFLRTYLQGKLSIVCPDTMNYINDNSVNQNDRSNWLPLARHYQLNRIYLSSGKIHIFSCGEVATTGKTTGMALSPCTMQELANAIKFFMGTCEKENIVCELQEGTLLGAVKFNKVLPWERDADLTFFTGNYSALKNLQQSFSVAGYSLSDSGGVWCCVDGRKAGGKFMMGSGMWNIEVYGQHIMDTEKLANLSMPPTKVFFDGMWVSVPRNPGLYVRNRYGREVYRHAQHWMTRGMTSGWDVYKTATFSACPQTGSHMCLDQYITDGNLQFEVPTP